MTHVSSSASVWPEATEAPPSRRPHKAIAAALCVGAAVAAFVAIPAASFRSKAVLSVAEIGSPVSAILSRSAAEAAVSKPVMTRAAESLIGTGVPAPEPDLAERAALALHLGGGKATGKVARLAARLPGLVMSRPGEMPGTLDIVASHEEAERAAQIASAIADALILGQDDTMAAARRKREADAAVRLERLKGDAAAARRQLAALGGGEADPAQALATAAMQTARAQARAETIRAIIASGSPPLSDRRDVPSAIETLQSAYLDLAGQLAKARETLGDRHTTIISLNAELRHAASSLTAEWRRLGKLADAEVAAAREREMKLRKAENGSGSGVTRRESIDDARRKVQVADEAVGRALASIREPAADERGYRLVLRPMVRNATDGFSLLSRLLLAGLAGGLTFGLAALAPRMRRIGPARVLVQDRDSLPSRHPTEADAGHHARIGGKAPNIEDDAFDGGPDLVAAAFDVKPATSAAGADVALTQAMLDLLPRLETIDPAFGPVPTIMVASNEITADVSPVALALGRSAAASGHRVLLIEATRSRPEITAAVEADAEPILVDYFGTLRVALRAPANEGALFVAPNLQQGARIASVLARQGGTPLVDDIGLEFDLVVIDGGRSTDAASAGWGADVYLRVGRHRSQRDDSQFAAAFGVSREAVLGAVVGSVLAQAAADPAPPTARPVTPVGRAGPRASAASGAISSSPVRHAPRRRIAAR